ncbi:OsmC family protein [Amphibacillus sp. MSJ-3]|uniref:OsmC family protein n=1 Tax=Amphibacillus sp. MSJ-3 TaxID=2841505 RepID=UPI001C0EE7F1|nr:OsmC family protein [Amphibacillus sp. MSJ-3]MBU5595612.1 OsmC family protein [Amphibacillus sp. MSJ-3]
MITLKKDQDKVHEITNDRGTVHLATSSNSGVDAFAPGDFLNSSIAICMGLTLDALIERDQLDIPSYSIEISSTKAEDARPSRLEKIDVKLTFDADLDEKTKNRLAKSAKRGCTMGNTIEHGAPINVVYE